MAYFKVIKYEKRKFFLKKLCRFTFLFLLINLLVFPPSYTLATNSNYGSSLSEEELKEHSNAGILFYDPNENSCSAASYTAKPTGSQITWIGDSYSVMSYNYNIFSEKLPGIDFGNGTINTSNSYIEGSKFFATGSSDNPSGISILEDIISTGTLREYLVFALGTNGGMANWGGTDYFQKVVDLAGSNTKVVFTTTRTLNGDNDAETGKMYNTFNESLRNFAANTPNVYVADWDKTVGNNINKYFNSNDGIHPKDKAAFEAWFNTIYNALPGGSVGTLAGNNSTEQAWNYFATAGIPGVSDNPAAISGIIGNLLEESPDITNDTQWGIDPFYGDGTYYGIIQDKSGTIKAAVDAAGYGQYWHQYPSKSKAPQDAIAVALQIELDYLTKQYPRFVGTDGWERQAFLNNLDAPADKNSPEAWAELFEISVEGAFETTNVSGQAVNDTGVQAYNKKYFSSHSRWQHLEKRRNNARKVYDVYASASTLVVAASLTSPSSASSTTPTSMTWNDGWLTSGMPGLIIQDVTKYANLSETLKPGYTTPDNKPNKILLHSTEGTTNGYEAYPATNKYPAHFIIDLKKQEAYQNLPITNRALATSGSDGSSVQIEIVGFSTSANANSPYYLQSFTATEWDYLALLLSAIAEETGIPLTTNMNWDIDYNNPNAIRSNDSNDFNNNITGIVGHMHSADDNHIDPGNIWPMLEQAITRNPTASQFASGSLTSACGVGATSAAISAGGLNYEQAKKLAMFYGSNLNNSSSNAMGATMWGYCGGGGSNCVSFSKFFVNKFTQTNINYQLDNGWHTVNSIASNSGISTGFEPQIWSVFQVGNASPGHTGVVVGYENGEWIVVQASCSRGNNGYRGTGDGTEAGGGSAFVIKSSDMHTNVMGYRNSQIKYAYFADQIDLNKISQYLISGE